MLTQPVGRARRRVLTAMNWMLCGRNELPRLCTIALLDRSLGKLIIKPDVLPLGQLAEFDSNGRIYICHFCEGRFDRLFSDSQIVLQASFQS